MRQILITDEGLTHFDCGAVEVNLVATGARSQIDQFSPFLGI